MILAHIEAVHAAGIVGMLTVAGLGIAAVLYPGPRR